MAAVAKKPLYRVTEGVRHPAMFLTKCFSESLQYKPRSDDVFIVTYPKCGTTWMQNLVMYIFRKGEELSDPREILKRSPFIDMLGQQAIDRMPRPGAIKTHLPYNRMPYSPEAKYIFVARNPKDCCVSLYHHNIVHPGFAYWDGVFDQFFELFISGEVQYGDYFDHMLSWFPHRNDANVFHTTYEDMKEDTESIAIRLAGFLGKEYSELLERDNVALKNILHFSSFAYTKETISDVYDFVSSADAILNNPDSPDGFKHIVNFVKSLGVSESRPQCEFVRKGKIGDWKNYLSDEQCERLQNKFIEKFKGTDIPNLWSSDILR